MKFTGVSLGAFAVVATPDPSATPPNLGYAFNQVSNPHAPINGIQIVADSVDGVDFVWTGATNIQWSVPGNWLVNGVVPNRAPGSPSINDNLVFPAGAANLSSSNDLAASTFNTITIADNYTFGSATGNVMTVTGNIQCSNAPTGATVGFPVKLATANSQFSVNSGSILNFSSPIAGGPNSIEANGNPITVLANGTFNLASGAGLGAAANGGSLTVTGTGTFNAALGSTIAFNSGTAVNNIVNIASNNCSILGAVTSTQPGPWTVVNNNGLARITPSNAPAAGVGIAQISISGTGASNVGNLTGLNATSSITTLTTTLSGNIAQNAATQTFASFAGTVSNAANSATVTGTGTNFLGQIAVGDAITIGSTVQNVTAIASNVSLTVGTAIAAANTNVGYVVTKQISVTITANSLNQTGGTITVSNLNLNVNNPTNVFPNSTPVANGTLAGTLQGNAATAGVGTLGAPVLNFTGAGTSATTNGSATVTGTNTLYLSQVLPGDVLVIGSQTLTVASIASNTSLTANANATASVGATTYTVARGGLYPGTGTSFNTGFTVANGPQVCVGDTIIMTVGGVTQQQLVTSVPTTALLSTAAPFNPAPGAGQTYSVLRGTCTIGGSGFITQTAAGVIAPGFASINQNMNATTGVLQLNGTNTNLSQFTLTNGFLQIGNGSAIGPATGTNTGGVLSIAGGTLQPFGAAQTIPNFVLLNANLTVGPTPNTFGALGSAFGTPYDLTLTNGLSFNNLSRTITVNNLSTNNGLTCANQAAAIQSGFIAAQGKQLVKQGAGILTITGPGTYGQGTLQGQTLISAGTVVVSGQGTIGDGNNFPDERIDAGATLIFDYSGTASNATVNRVADNDSMQLNGEGATFWIKGNTSAAVNEIVNNFSISGGTGTVKISNAVGGNAVVFQANAITNSANANFSNAGNPTQNTKNGFLNLVLDSSSGGVGVTQFKTNTNPPANNQPLPWATVTAIGPSSSPPSTIINYPAMYSGPLLAGSGIVPLISAGSVYNSVKSGNWDDVTVWSPNGVPTSTDQIIVNAGHTIDLDGANRQINTVTFAQNGSITDTAGTDKLQVFNLIQSLFTYGNTSILANVELDASTQIDLNNSGALTLSGLVTGSFALTKTGPGELKMLNGGNTYSGGTFLGSPTATGQDLVGGTLTLGADSTGNPVTSGPLGTGTLTFNYSGNNVSSPHTFLQGSGTAARTVGNNITEIAAATIWTFGGTANLTLTGNVTLLANTTWQFYNTGKTSFVPAGTNVISGAFSITKVGSGTLAMSGQNTFTGGFVLGSAASNGPGVGPLELQSDSSSAGPVTPGANGAAVTSGPLGTGTLTINSVLPAAVTANGFATLVASGGARTVRNTLALNGQLNISGTNLTLGTSQNNAVLGGFAATSGGGRLLNVTNPVTTIDSPITQTLTGTSLDKDGSGTLVLSRSCSYSGNTTVANGVLSLNMDTGQLTATTAIAIQPGATFDISGGTGTITVINHINDAAVLNLNGGTFRYAPPSTTTTSQTETVGSINVTAASTIRLDNSSVAAASLQLTSTATNFNFAGGTLSFERVAGAGTGKTNLFLSNVATTFDVPQATVNGQFAEYNGSGATPEGLRAKISTAPFITAQNGDWNTGATWIGGNVPSATDNAVVHHQVSISANTVINSVSFDDGTSSPSLTLSGGNLTVTSGAINVGVGIGAIAPAPVINGTSALVFGSVSGNINNNTTNPSGLLLAANVGAGSTAGLTIGGNGTTTVSSVLSFSGGLRVISGTTVLSNLGNTYTGGTAVSGGTLSISNDANLGAVSGVVTLQGGTAPNGASANNLITGAGTISTSGSPGTTVTGTGTFFSTNGAVGQLGVGDTITASGQTCTITAVASATSCTVTPGFNPNVSAATYTGARFVSVVGAGTIAAGSITVIGTGTTFTTQLQPNDFIYANGQMQIVSVINSNTNLTVGAAFSPQIPSGTPFTIFRTVNAAGTATNTAASATVSGGSTTSSFLTQAAVGDYIVIGGTINLITAIASNTSLTVQNAITNANTNVTYQILKANTTGGGTLTINSNDVQLNEMRGIGFGPTGGNINVPSGLNLTINSGLFGNFPLVKNGAGRLIVQNPAVVPASVTKRQAVTVVAGGILRLGATDCLGGNLGSNNACLTVVNSGAVLEVAPTITTGGAQRTIFNDGSTLRGIGNCTASMQMTPLPGSTVTIQHNLIAPLDRFTLSGLWAGTGSDFQDAQNIVTIVDAQPAGFNSGVVVLTNNNNGYEGTWVLKSGITNVTSNANVLGDGNPQLTTVQVNSGATLAVGISTLTAQVILNGGTLGCGAGNGAISNATGATGPNGTTVPSLIVTADSTIQLDDILTPGTARQLTISGIMAGSGNLKLLGFDGSRAASSTTLTSTLILTNPNNQYTGTFTINSNAQLSAQGAGTLGQGANPATVNLNGGYLEVRNNTTVAFPGKIVLNTPSITGTFNQMAVLQNGTFIPNQVITMTSLTVPAGNNVLTIHGNNTSGQNNTQMGFASAAFTGTPTFDIQSAILRFDSPITGSGGLIKQGPKDLQLNAANAYTGDTTVLAGEVVLNGATSAVAGNVVVNSGAEFNITSAVTNTDCVPNGKNIVLNGGSLTVAASPSLAHNETVANLNVGNGTATVNLVPNGAGGDAQLTVGALNLNSGGSLVLNRNNNGVINNANLLITGAVAGTPYYKVTVNESTGITGRGVYHTAAQPDLGVVAYTGTSGGPYLFVSEASGQWNDQTKWRRFPDNATSLGFPGAADDVRIKPGHIMDLNNADRTVNSVTFQGSMPTIGQQFVQVSTVTNTLTTATSVLLVNIPSPVGKKLTGLGQFIGAAAATPTDVLNTTVNSNVVSTVTNYVPATGTITFSPPVLAPFILTEQFTLDFQATAVTDATHMTAASLAPYGGASSVLIGQTIAMTSGSQNGSGAVIASVDSSGNVVFANSGFATLPAAGDSFQICSGQVSGTVSSAGSVSSFTAAGLASLGGTNSVLIGQLITFTGGAQAGRSATISGLSTAGVVSLATPTPTISALPAAPATSDTFVINGASNAITGANTLTVVSGSISVTPLPGGQGQGFGLHGEQYGNGITKTSINFTNLAINRIDPAMNLSGSITYDPDGPGANGEEVNSGVWTGFIVADFTEEYTMQSLSDDGGRVFIGNQLVLDQFFPNGLAQNVFNFTAGVRYPIRYEWENSGTGASWQLSWNSANQTAGQLQVVPSTNLFPSANTALIACNLNFGAATGAISNSGGGLLQIGQLGFPLASGVISGGAGLEVEGNGAVQLNGANTYAGSTNIASGFVQVSSNSSLSAGTVTMQQNTHIGGVLSSSQFGVTLANPFTLAGDCNISNSPNTLTFGGTMTLTSNRLVTFNNYNSSNANTVNNLGICNFNGPIVDGGAGYSFAKAGTGFLQLNAKSTYGGNSIVYRGQINLGISDALPTSSAIVMAGRQLNGGTQFLGNTTAITNAQAILNLNGFNQTCTGISLGFNDVYNLPAISGDSIITSSNGGILTVNVPADVSGIQDRYLGILTGSLSLVKNGPGSLGLYTVCTYTGSTTINAGTLSEGIASGVPVASAVVVNAAGTLDMNGTASTVGNGSATLTINNGAVVNTSLADGSLTLGGDVFATGTAGHIDGTVNVAANVARQIFVNSASDTLTINAAIQGGNGATNAGAGLTLNKQGAGTLLLTSGESTFPGLVIVNGGTLELAGSTASLINVTAMQINNGTFLIDNSNTVAGANPNRLYDQLAMTFNGGAFKMLAPLNVTRTETIGLINFTGGNTAVVLQANGTGDSQLIASSFSRSNGATITLDRSNAIAGAGLETGNLFFATPSPLTNNGNVPWALVTDNSASPNPVVNSQAIYTTLQGVIEGGPVGGTLYISNGTGGGDWNTVGTWKDVNGNAIATVDASHPGQPGDRVRIIGNDIVTLNAGNTIDQVELTGSGQLNNGTGGNTLTFNSGSTNQPSLNQILVNGLQARHRSA